MSSKDSSFSIVFSCGCCKSENDDDVKVKKKKKKGELENKQTLVLDNECKRNKLQREIKAQNLVESSNLIETLYTALTESFNVDSKLSISLRAVDSEDKSICPVTSMSGSENYAMESTSQSLFSEDFDISDSSEQFASEHLLKVLSQEVDPVNLSESEAAGDNALVQPVETKRPEDIQEDATKLSVDSTVRSKHVVEDYDELTWIQPIFVPERPAKFPYYVTAPVEEIHGDLFHNVFQLFLHEGIFFTTKHGKRQSPFHFLASQKLCKQIDLTLPQQAVEHGQLVEFIGSVMYHQPRQGHPLFMKQCMAGLEPYSCTADIIASCLNSNTSSYLVSTVTTLMEMEVIRKVCQLVGYDGGGDGIMIGSTLAIGYAMKMALENFQKRKQYSPALSHKLVGLCNSQVKRPSFFVNERCLKKYQKCAIFQGFGMNSVISVTTHQNGKMDVGDLNLKIGEELIVNWGTPLMVVGTVGTPTVRAIDELSKIAEICQSFGLWFHVDATNGGALMCSSILKHKLKGIEQSDSLNWSPHYLLGVPCPSRLFVVPAKHKEQLSSHYSGVGLQDDVQNSFKKTPLYESQYDQSAKYLVENRRTDVFKLWLMWKAKGTINLGYHVDFIFKNAQFCLEEMKKREGFLPVMDHFEGTNVCFWFVPSGYRGILHSSPEYKEKISKLSYTIVRVLQEKGICILSNNQLPAHHNKPVFLVIGLHNSAVTRLDISFVLNHIERVGEIVSNPKHSKYEQLVNN